MQKISFKEYSESMQINPASELFVGNCEDLQYLKFSNLLVNPDKMLNYLDKFPALDKDDFLVNDKIISYAPGYQQLIPNNCLQDLTQFFNNFLFQIVGKKFRIEWYTNIFWPEMQVTETSRYPHIDTFDMAINIWLTENHDQDGTAFYKTETDYHTKPVVYDFEADTKDKWKPFDGNSTYKKYAVVPSTYNSAVIYNGKYYHSPYYVPMANKMRKSLVGGVFVD